MISIENDKISVKVSNFGAELQSVVSKENGKEYIWCADPAVWSGKAPILFPICGRLCEDSFLYQGASYFMPKHGFARKNEFKLESSNETCATFLLSADAKTLSMYPFLFELRATYEIEGNKLKSTYSVKNVDDKTIFFSLGAHPAYNVKLGGKVVFEHAQDWDTLTVDSNGLIDGVKPIAKNTDTIVLREDTFIDDALIFEAPKSSSVTIQSPEGESLVKMSFGNIPYLLIWAKPGAEYVCIEPWNGIPDEAGKVTTIEEKKGIIKLEQGKEFVFETVAEFL